MGLFFPFNLRIERRQASGGIFYAVKHNSCQYFPTKVLWGGKCAFGLEKSVFLTYLDFYKGFDKVPHQRLIKTKQNQVAILFKEIFALNVQLAKRHE